MDEIKCHTACSITLFCAEAPPFLGTCFLWLDRCRMSVPSPIRETRLDTSHLRNHVCPFSHWGCDAEQLSDPHQQDGESTTSPSCAARCDWGACTPSVKRTVLLHHPLPAKVTEGHVLQGIQNQQLLRKQGQISILSILKCTHPIQTTYMPDPVHSKKKKQPKNSPSVSITGEENRSPPSHTLAQAVGVWDSLCSAALEAWLSLISHENATRTGLWLTPNWGNCQSLTSTPCHVKLHGTAKLDDGLMYSIYLKKYLEGRISHSPNSQINAPLSCFIDHFSLAVRVTLKLRQGLNASLPYSPPVSPWSSAWSELKMLLLCIVLVPWDVAQGCFCQPDPSWKYKWTPRFMMGLRDWKGANTSTLLAQSKPRCQHNPVHWAKTSQDVSTSGTKGYWS